MARRRLNWHGVRVSGLPREPKANRVRTWSEIQISGYLTSYEIEVLGVEFLSLDVVRFYDDLTEKPWWARQHEILGTIKTPCIDRRPMDWHEVQAFVRQTFGHDANVLY